MDTKQDLIKKIEQMVEGIKFAMLTTTTLEGKLFSRPMAVMPNLSLNEGIYFFSRNDSPKILEINENKEVCVSFSNPEKQTYVSFSGTATVNQDLDQMRKLWNPLYKAWFPEGLEDPHLCLITIKPEEAEYWDSPSSPVVKVMNLIKIISGKDVKLGNNEKIDL